MTDQETTVRLTVNGRRVSARVPVDATLLHLLRERLGLTGAKLGCGQGQCGACTVELDGRPVASCIHLAAQTDGCAVSTVEGLPADHPLPAALAEHGAVQCGFCIPGVVMAAVAAFGEGSAPDEDDVREALVGNLCRCTGYATIVSAVHAWCRTR